MFFVQIPCNETTREYAVWFIRIPILRGFKAIGYNYVFPAFVEVQPVDLYLAQSKVRFFQRRVNQVFQTLPALLAGGPNTLPENTPLVHTYPTRQVGKERC